MCSRKGSAPCSGKRLKGTRRKGRREKDDRRTADSEKVLRGPLHPVVKRLQKKVTLSLLPPQLSSPYDKLRSAHPLARPSLGRLRSWELRALRLFRSDHHLTSSEFSRHLDGGTSSAVLSFASPRPRVSPTASCCLFLRSRLIPPPAEQLPSSVHRAQRLVRPTRPTAQASHPISRRVHRPAKNPVPLRVRRTAIAPLRSPPSSPSPLSWSSSSSSWGSFLLIPPAS
jgi:hypothetical protein